MRQRVQRLLFKITIVAVLGWDSRVAPASELNEDNRSAPPMEIVQKIRKALANDSLTAAIRPNISTKRGVVTLTGVVDDRQTKLAAEENAKKVPGVLEVKNFLKVKGEAKRTSDAEMQRRIEAALNERSDFYDDEIHVSVLNGEALLSGQVETLREAALAEKIVSRVPGVSEVSNKLKTPSYNGPFPGLGYPYRWPRDDIYRYNWTDPDTRIRRDVESELRWNPHVDLDGVKVSVQHGIVTLEGKVDSRFEKDAVTRGAYRAGARDVRNWLNVEPE